MQISGNNLNQYAKKANETGSIYHEDIERTENSSERNFAGTEKGAGKIDSDYVRQVRRWRQQS